MDKKLLMAAFSKPDPAIPDGWTDTGRTKRGKPVYVVYATFAKRNNPVHHALGFARMDTDALVLTPGMSCPACLGTGRRVWGTCYWCNDPTTRGSGKGYLTERDVSFIEKRRRGAGPLCDVVAA